MSESHHRFGVQLAQWLTGHNPAVAAHSAAANKVVVKNQSGEHFTLDLTPVVLPRSDMTAYAFLHTVHSIDQLTAAYYRLRESQIFEQDIPEAMAQVHPYAQQYIDTLFTEAARTFTAADAQLIATWASELDVFAAVKVIESLLNSRADLQLLNLAKQRGWQVHFDHLALRCGSKAHQDAERVVEMLITHHGYTLPQQAEEAFYQFPDGWNAYVLFKLMHNGQMIRLFIDQSDAEDQQQIIQHWNRVYGYTAHHLALRATQMQNKQRVEIPLPTLIETLEQAGVSVLTPTGLYTQGLLAQVFTRPERSETIPQDLKNELAHYDSNLPKVIENGKLLEMVSRRELPAELKTEWFALNGLKFEPNNPLHSTPIYPYFLPAQAAHVIRTSLHTL